MDEYVEWIKRGLKKPGKTQKGLAQHLDIDAAAVSRMLRGERKLKTAEIEPAADYLNEPPPRKPRDAAGFREAVNDFEIDLLKNGNEASLSAIVPGRGPTMHMFEKMLDLTRLAIERAERLESENAALKAELSRLRPTKGRKRR